MTSWSHDQCKDVIENSKDWIDTIWLTLLLDNRLSLPYPQCAWNLDPSVHWNATGEKNVGCQCASSGLPVAFQWSSSVFQLCKLTLDRHWDTTGCWHRPVWFQWHPSVLVAPVVFQCVPIMQINTGTPLGASIRQCGSSGIPVYLWLQWSSSVVCPVVSQCTDRIWFGGH